MYFTFQLTWIHVQKGHCNELRMEHAVLRRYIFLHFCYLAVSYCCHFCHEIYVLTAEKFIGFGCGLKDK